MRGSVEAKVQREVVMAMTIPEPMHLKYLKDLRSRNQAVCVGYMRQQPPPTCREVVDLNLRGMEMTE
jgi:hypothetical protein